MKYLIRDLTSFIVCIVFLLAILFFQSAELQAQPDAVEESAEAFSDEDVDMVVEKTGKGREEVKAALEKSEGDIAEAIMDLKG